MKILLLVLLSIIVSSVQSRPTRHSSRDVVPCFPQILRFPEDEKFHYENLEVKAQSYEPDVVSGAPRFVTIPNAPDIYA